MFYVCISKSELQIRDGIEDNYSKLIFSCTAMKTYVVTPH